MLLTLHDKRTVEFTASELAQTLTRLQAQNQSYCLGLYHTAHVRVCGSLLVMDVGWPIGRHLIETFQVGTDPTFEHNVKSTMGQSAYTLNQALSGSGYVGSTVWNSHGRDT